MPARRGGGIAEAPRAQQFLSRYWFREEPIGFKIVLEFENYYQIFSARNFLSGNFLRKK
jgi:hypothetical protein